MGLGWVGRRGGGIGVESVIADLHRMPRGLDGGHGHGEAEGGAGAEAAFDGDLSAVRFDEAANQREAEAGAIAGSARGVEAAEDGGQALGLDAAAVVVHEELDAVLDLLGARADVSRRRACSE